VLANALTKKDLIVIGREEKMKETDTIRKRYWSGTEQAKHENLSWRPAGQHSKTLSQKTKVVITRLRHISRNLSRNADSCSTVGKDNSLFCLNWF
jgi:hypothetical protein